MEQVVTFGVPPEWHFEFASIPFTVAGLTYDVSCAHSWTYRTPTGLVTVKALDGKALHCYRIPARQYQITMGGRNTGKSFLRRAMEDPKLKKSLEKAVRKAVRDL